MGKAKSIREYYSLSVIDMRRHLTRECDSGPEIDLPEHMQRMESIAEEWDVPLDYAIHNIWEQDDYETIPYDQITEAGWIHMMESKDLLHPMIYMVRKEFEGTEWFVPVSKILWKIEIWRKVIYENGDPVDWTLYGKRKYDYYSFDYFGIPDDLANELDEMESKIILGNT